MALVGAHVHAAGDAPAPPRGPEPDATTPAVETARTLIHAAFPSDVQPRIDGIRVLQDGQIVCARVTVGADTKPRAAIVILRPGRSPSSWVDQGNEVVAHTACEVA